MKKARQLKWYFVVILLLPGRAWPELTLQEQNQNKIEIKKQAMQAMNAFRGNDYDRLLDYTYPRLIELSGGREKLLKSLKLADAENKKEALQLLKSRVYAKKPIVMVGNEWHCLIERHSYWQFSKHEKTWMRSHILAVSKNQGKHWYFLEVNSLSDPVVAKLFSKFDERIRKNFYYFGPGFKKTE